MSLVGNLEDLSLGDLLQIVSLSQKSGVLALGSSDAAGQIVFRSGLVHAAGIKGRTPDLRTLLIAAGLIDAARFDSLRASTGPRTALRPEQVVEGAGLDPERVDAAIRKSAEAAIFEMFGWDSGEFSFDARRDGEADESYPCLRDGINAQYLAMEGMRLRDEQTRSAPAPAPAPAPATSAEDELFFGAEPLEVDDDVELELESIWEAESPAVPPTAPPTARVEPSPAASSAPPGDPRQRAIEIMAERVVSLADLEDPSDPPPAKVDGRSRPVVVVDPDAASLDWVKAALEGHFARVHVFQRAEQGLARIRQYLIRGEVPIVLISPSAPIDPLSGIHGLPDFVKRLRAQAARIVVVGLREAVEGTPAAAPSHFDAVVQRPTREKLRPAAAAEAAVLRDRLLTDLTEILARPERDRPAAGRPKASPAADPLAAPAAAGEQSLAAARSQNEVLAILLDVAAVAFARVAVLALRDGQAFPVAGRGIETLEIDPLATSPRLACRVSDTSLLQRVVDSRQSLTGTLQSQADRLLVALFGPVEPRTAFLAPILGPVDVLAVLYADQGGHRRPIPDPAALERLIAQAGEKLQAIAAERVKGEAGSGLF